jgi:hypothetical protein
MDHREDGQAVYELLIWFNNGPVPIVDVRVHPLFETSVRGSAAFLQHDVGVLIPGGAIPGFSQSQLDTVTRSPLKSEQSLRLIGYHDPLDIDKPYDPVQVGLVEQTAEVTGSHFETIDSAPSYRLQTNPLPGLDGALVLTDTGAIAGVAGFIESDCHLVPIATLRMLLTED